MAKVDLRKTVYNKDQFNRVVGGREFTTFTLDGDGVQFTVDDFFVEYDNLFLSIPILGDNNSHEYLVRRSGELVGFQRTNEDIQPLLDEITSLRQQLLEARQEAINLQIQAAGGNVATQLTDQFNELLEALNQPLPEFPDVIVNINQDGEDEDKNGSNGTGEQQLQLTDDTRTFKYNSNSPPTLIVDVLANDVDPNKGALTLVNISRNPNNGFAEIVNNKINYTPKPNLTSVNSDYLEYKVESSSGLEGKAILRFRFEVEGLGGGGGDNTGATSTTGTTPQDSLRTTPQDILEVSE